jgi:integrase
MTKSVQVNSKNIQIVSLNPLVKSSLDSSLVKEGSMFTDRQIRNLKPESKIKDTRGGQGFGIRVKPDGTKIFFYGYDSPVTGARRFLTLGEYPGLSLEDARIKHGEAYKMVKGGSDPLEIKQQELEEHRKAPTVADLVKEYIEKHAKASKKSWKEDQRCLEKEVLPLWGKRKAADIKKRDVVLLLEGIVERGSPVMSNNTLEKIRKMFNFAVERDILEFTPCYGVKKLTKKEHKDRVLTGREIVTVWNGLDTAAMTDEMKRALKLILVTAQRPGEVIGMHSNEITGDWWTIPAERAKNGKAHRVYLSATAKELIGGKEGYIFESPRGGKGMDVNAVAYSVRRNLERPNQDKSSSNGKMVVESWTPHDLRRTAATNLSALGFSDEVIDAVLNHVKKGVVAIYNRHGYDQEKQLALETWARKLESITTGIECNVLPMVRKANV